MVLEIQVILKNEIAKMLKFWHLQTCIDHLANFKDGYLFTTRIIVFIHLKFLGYKEIKTSQYVVIFPVYCA